jgi:hypothetical protein
MTLMKLRERPSHFALFACVLWEYHALDPTFFLHASLLGRARMNESSPEEDLEAVVKRHWLQRKRVCRLGTAPKLLQEARMKTLLFKRSVAPNQTCPITMWQMMAQQYGNKWQHYHRHLEHKVMPSRALLVSLVVRALFEGR